MRPEERITAGKSINEALTAFRESVNQPGRMFCTNYWLSPKLEQLRLFLSNPITQDEAEALLDVIYKRHWMEDLIEWLEDQAPVSWADYFAWRSDQKHRALRVRAEERKRRRAAGLDPYSDFKLFSDDDYPRIRISDTCPDCGSSDWIPIAYGRLDEDGEEDARLGEVLKGGSFVRDAARYCPACFNRWPTKPDVDKPTTTPESTARAISDSRYEYARLCALADLPANPKEPQVERAWARIDGSIRFLVSFETEKTPVIRNLEYSRLGGAPVYETVWPFEDSDEYPDLSTLAAVAALRFERTHESERHNLRNEWDKVRAHEKELDIRLKDDSYRWELAKQDRAEASRLLKLARAIPEQLPLVVSMRSSGRERNYLVRFPWGTVSVQRYQFSLLESLQYHCQSSCSRAEDPELAQDLARAAAMLAEFPRLAGADRQASRTQEAFNTGSN
jgi:hypothetical protein